MPEPLTAAIISTATSAIGSEIAGSIIDDATEAIEKISENAAIRFSNVGQDLIAQIEVSIEELLAQIGDQINETVAELTDSLKVQLYNLTLTVEQLVSSAIGDLDELSDDLVRNIRATLSRTWFMSEIYALDEIKGTLIPANLTTDCLIRVSGLNLGYDSEDIESVVKLKVEIPNSPKFVQLGAETSQHSVEFTLPIELMEEHRKESTITVLNAALDVRIKKDGFLWFDEKFKGLQPFKILIAPRVAGHLYVNAEVPSYAWVKSPELDVVYSNALPSGHGTSSSKVVHHRLTRNFSLPRAAVPPRLKDRRFYAGQRGACTGGGCSHLHECRIRVINNGSTLDVYTYNNSHAITVRIIGKVERFEKIGGETHALPELPIRNGEVLEIDLPKNFEIARISGRDMDHGLTDLVIQRDTFTSTYDMPDGKLGGLRFLGTSPGNEFVTYRFERKSV